MQMCYHGDEIMEEMEEVRNAIEKLKINLRG
jgi:hypothetical protein